ncbi:MAG TPA: hypothetical protein ENJ32_01215 [Crenotrichaceae bacterium]|nr:hypothetical protein [Crenotrichaceae bacterium]
MKNPLVSEIHNFGRFSLTAGVILFVLGSIGIALPVIMSMTASIFFGWLVFIAGMFWIYSTYKYSYKHWLDWIKPLLLIAVGLLVLFDPLSGVIALALIFTFYLMLDAAGSFYIAYSMHPFYGWGWMVVNGIASLLLATLLLIGWPQTTPVILGLFIGISLVFDGSVLIMIWWRVHKIEHNDR